MWAGRTGIGIGMVGVGVVLAELPRGGVAPLAVAAVVGLGLGAPAALAEWRTAVETDPVRVAHESLADLLGFGLVAVVLGAIGAGSWPALAASLLAWPLGAIAGRRGANGLLLALGALGAVLHLAWTGTAPPWTLLDPAWANASAWGPAALLGGLWLAGAGTGQWVGGPPRPPGKVRAPLAPLGAGLVAAALLAAGRGAAFEQHLGPPTLDVSHGLLALVAASAAGAAIVRPRGVGGSDWARPLAGAVLTALLASASAEARGWFGGAVLPWLGGASLAITAWSGAGADRWAAAAAALVLVGVGLSAGGPSPATVGDALWLGAVVAAGFWLVATRVVLARRHA